MRRASAALIALTFFAPGCSGPPQRLQSTQPLIPGGPLAHPSATQPASPLKPDDFPVLAAALAHLAADPEAPTHPALARNRGVVLHRVSAGASGFLSTDQLAGEFPDRGPKPPGDAVSDLQARNNGVPPTAFSRNDPATDRLGTPLDEFKPSSPGVVMADLDQSAPARARHYDDAFIQAHPTARGYARAWLPGYAADGRSAVLRLSVGPTAHGATATYLLRKDAAGKWTVAWRRFSLYA